VGTVVFQSPVCGFVIAGGEPVAALRKRADLVTPAYAHVRHETQSLYLGYRIVGHGVLDALEDDRRTLQT
jgi:hypothetical protein